MALEQLAQRLDTKGHWHLLGKSLVFEADMPHQADVLVTAATSDGNCAQTISEAPEQPPQQFTIANAVLVSPLILAKPQTMMNHSGRAVRALLKHYDLTLEDMLVIHDDLDLPPDAIRIRQGGGSGGHNGIRDIIAAIGPDFLRLKYGIGKPPGQMDASTYVLKRLSGLDLEELHLGASRCAEAAWALMTQGVTWTQNRYHEPTISKAREG
ncbi:MAG: aminoacyl-tRNA hydrolase [Coriobacteriales bacterium]|nr:aminoacyl-tRNA hydrolase [Coriobacteriales bacterium]